MSILATAKKVGDMQDKMFIIYGPPGSGKTVLASSFPKTKEKPLLYVDILEGGTDSIPDEDRENLEVVSIEDFEQLDELFTEIIEGYTDQTGKVVKKEYATIVIDSATQLEFLLKQHLRKSAGKTRMNLNLWGYAKDDQDIIYNTLKLIHRKTGAFVVIIVHEKEIKDENNPEFNQIIPALMTTASKSMCAKASYVWYTKVEYETTVDADNNVIKNAVFNTYIKEHPYLSTKTRRKKGTDIPEKVKDFNFKKFYKGIYLKNNQTNKQTKKETSEQ